MNKLLLTIFIIPLSISALAQKESKIANWKLFFELKECIIKHKDYAKGVELFERLHSESDSINLKALEFGIIAYDKTNQQNKVIQLMSQSAEQNDYTFCQKDYTEERHYSETLINSEEFQRLCPVYDYAIKFPTEYSEFRDSLVKYLIVGSDLRVKQSIFIKMGYESYYPSGSLSRMSLIDRIILSEEKIDSLIRIHGYPTVEKVVDPWIEFLIGGSIVHSTTVERYQYYANNYKNEMSPKDLAYVTDKISVELNRPQIYGTQLNLINGKHKLYKTVDMDELDKRRMEKGLKPIDMYLKSFGINQ